MRGFGKADQGCHAAAVSLVTTRWTETWYTVNGAFSETLQFCPRRIFFSLADL